MRGKKTVAPTFLRVHHTHWTVSCFCVHYVFMQSLLTTVGLNVIRKTKRLIIKQDIGTPRHKTEFAYPHPAVL